ncbi:MAG: hypothetical protein AAF628_33260 [Planctomycetota bacterium]
MSKHEWREPAEDGDVRLVTATRQSARWTLRSRLKSESEWTEHQPIDLDDLESLREVLWNKHQRRRVPYEFIGEIDRLIDAAREDRGQ